MIPLLAWLKKRAKFGLKRTTDGEGSLLVAVARACESVRIGAVEDEALAIAGNKIVRREIDKHAITYEEYKKWRRKNPLIFVPVVSQSDELIGFFDIFPLRECDGRRLLSGELDEHSLSLNNIVPLAEISAATYIHIATIVANGRQKSFSGIVAREVLILKLNEFIESHYKPVETRTFTAYAQSKEGEALLTRCGFVLALPANQNKQQCPLYVLRPETSDGTRDRFRSLNASVGGRNKRSKFLGDLNGRIESIELVLRRMIAIAVENDSKRLPSHVQAKIKERIEAAKKKDASLDGGRLQTLEHRLEFADLRELQDSILSKPIWPAFERRFVNKESTASKFGQLAELRNALRHSRLVTEIVKMEGEAAVIWFEVVVRREPLSDDDPSGDNANV